MSNDEYQQQKDWIKLSRGLEDLISNENIGRYPYKELTEQDIIDFIKALENNENKK